MTRIRIYFDEDSHTRPVLTALTTTGVDVTSAEQEKRRGLSDPEQLAFAVETRRVLFTKNIGDYQQLHNEYMSLGAHHFGLIMLGRPYYAVHLQIRGLTSLLDARSAEDMVDRVEFLSSWL